MNQRPRVQPGHQVWEVCLCSNRQDRVIRIEWLRMLVRYLVSISNGREGRAAREHHFERSLDVYAAENGSDGLAHTHTLCSCEADISPEAGKVLMVVRTNMCQKGLHHK